MFLRCELQRGAGLDGLDLSMVLSGTELLKKHRRSLAVTTQ
jgi:hypothetical protein